MENTDIGTDRLGQNGDEFYELLMEAHEGLSEQQSHALNMRLVLILANQVADLEVLKDAIEAASKT